MRTLLEQLIADFHERAVPLWTSGFVEESGCVIGNSGGGVATRFVNL